MESSVPVFGLDELQRMKDAEHLRILVVCHYIYAGVVALFSLFPLIHVGLGLLMTFHPGFFPAPASGGASGPPPQWAGLIFVVLGAIFIVVGETIAVLTFFAGRALRNRRRRVFVLVVAGLSCLNVPMGTALGVFTILVLTRPTVQQLFEPGRVEPLVGEAGPMG